MRSLVIILVLCASASAQPQKVTVGIFTPTVEFGAATARLSYVKALANAIEQNTGLDVEARSYANLAALKADKVDFAIIDGPCVATNAGWRLLASALIGGSTTRAWALHSSAGTQMQGLRGKKLAYAQTGCNDAGFVDHAMLDGEVDVAFFGARVGKADLTAAVAEVASYKTAQAVFAPVGAAKGLTKVLETGAVPNPAFVDVSGRLPAATVDKVAAAVLGYGGGGAIAGWTKPSRDIYTSLAGRMSRSVKLGVFAAPEPVRIDARDVLIEPPSLRDSALVDVRHHFVRSPGARMQ
ncbi:MAG: hypothetical protein WKG01_05205 [Kofleriaceae bacterium]